MTLRAGLCCHRGPDLPAGLRGHAARLTAVGSRAPQSGGTPHLCAFSTLLRLIWVLSLPQTERQPLNFRPDFEWRCTEPSLESGEKRHRNTESPVHDTVTSPLTNEFFTCVWQCITVLSTLTLPHSHSHNSHSLRRTQSCTHSCTLTCSHTQSCTHTHSYPHSHTYTIIHTYIHAHLNSESYTHTLTLAHSLTSHTHAHSRTHALTH